MSTELIENSPVASTRGLEGSLVAPVEFGQRVPNHLCETKIFTCSQEHSRIKTKPLAVNFEGFSVGKLHQKSLHVINASVDNIGVHIIPPSTRHFTINYNKTTSYLVPGLNLNVTINFRPSEWKYYSDSIKIHSKSKDNILVPICAYPTVDTSSFPRSVTFVPTPVGQSRSHTISLSNPIPVEFEYHMDVIRHHPSFEVSPLKGIIPCNGTMAITVKYSPLEYATSVMELQLKISQYHFKPVICTFTGNALPGLAVERYKEETKKKSIALKSQREPPKMTKKSKRSLPSSIPQPCNYSETFEYEGIQFPINLDTPSAVARVLSQKQQHHQMKQLTHERKTTTRGGTRKDSYQSKESTFIQRATEAANEEKANRLRWVTHLGANFISDKEKKHILKSRDDLAKAYQMSCQFSNDSCFGNARNLLDKRRTRRKLSDAPLVIPSFDTQSNTTWMRRHRSLQRFIQVGRQVIIQVRCQKILKLLHNAIQTGKISTSTSSGFNGGLIKFSPSIIHPPCFPEYIDNDNHGDTPPSNPIQVQPVTVPPTSYTPILLQLQIPQEYKLLNYNKLPVPSRYMPTEINRSLRTGAEAEYNSLTAIPGVDLSFVWKKKTEVDVIVEEDEITSLLRVPSELLDQKRKEDAYHIFNQCPEVINSLLPSQPNSEVTLEHYLSPLATGTGAPQPQTDLDPYDGIPDVMTWKQFPSPFITSMARQKTISAVWRPSLTDPFSSELLPHMLDPPQFTGPQPDDILSGW
jgi:hypothetical protein